MKGEHVTWQCGGIITDYFHPPGSKQAPINVMHYLKWVEYPLMPLTIVLNVCDVN